MAFDGSEGTAISDSQAAELTAAYREANPGQIISCFFGRTILQNLLNQGGKGLRFYYGLNGGTPHLVVVGADENENDQLGEGFLIADDGMLGPPRSGRQNFLNS
ncbi:hypothetical protein [Hymenobacter ruricola]|uniref:Uncharacterized protein n=1 Tax=Hymenobacter ruricola TaxID=2791023 RepID=A0ABS0I4Z0_9BACT|nr:hypothetical protein [Hymenobacter ruricola]MBF9222015.1 hypothetical protein [Hymenobacter ruricola]